MRAVELDEEKSARVLDRDAGPVDPDADLKVALDAATGLSLTVLYDFRECARRLKQTESDYRDAQQAYGEAVKRLSDEAVK